MRHVWVCMSLLATVLGSMTSAFAAELDGQYQVTVKTTPTPGVTNSYTFEYRVKNIDQGTEWLDWPMPDGYRTGLDGFFIQVPSSAVITEVVSPEPYYAGAYPGYWDYVLAPPQPTNGRLLMWWGYDLGSMYPIGQEAVFSFRADGVALGSTPAVVFTFGDATAEAGNYYYADFGATVTGPVEIPFTASAFEAPMGTKKKLGSTLPVKFQLFQGDVEMQSPEQIGQALGLDVPVWPRIVLYDATPVADALGIDLPEDGNVGEGGGLGDCFRYSDGHWIFNLRLNAPIHASGSFVVKVQIGDLISEGFILEPANDLFQTK